MSSSLFATPGIEKAARNRSRPPGENGLMIKLASPGKSSLTESGDKSVTENIFGSTEFLRAGTLAGAMWRMSRGRDLDDAGCRHGRVDRQRRGVEAIPASITDGSNDGGTRTRTNAKPRPMKSWAHLHVACWLTSSRRSSAKADAPKSTTICLSWSDRARLSRRAWPNYTLSVSSRGIQSTVFATHRNAGAVSLRSAMQR